MRKIWGLISVFIILIVVLVSWGYTYVETYWFVHFKHMQFVVGSLNRNLFEKYF